MSRRRAIGHGLLEWIPDAVVVSDAAGRIGAADLIVTSQRPVLITERTTS